MYFSNIFYKLPVAIYSGFLTGFVLKIILPNEDELSVFMLNRRNIIFAGIFSMTLITYIREDMPSHPHF